MEGGVDARASAKACLNLDGMKRIVGHFWLKTSSRVGRLLTDGEGRVEGLGNCALKLPQQRLWWDKDQEEDTSWQQ